MAPDPKIACQTTSSIVGGGFSVESNTHTHTTEYIIKWHLGLEFCEFNIQIYTFLLLTPNSNAKRITDACTCGENVLHWQRSWNYLSKYRKAERQAVFWHAHWEQRNYLRSIG